MATTILVKAKGYRPRRVTLEHVRHVGTAVYPDSGAGRPNVDTERFRVRETGYEFDLPLPDAADLFPASLRVARSLAHHYGLEPR
jgi:hypothetical protein